MPQRRLRIPERQSLVAGHELISLLPETTKPLGFEPQSSDRCVVTGIRLNFVVATLLGILSDLIYEMSPF